MALYAAGWSDSLREIFHEKTENVWGFTTFPLINAKFISVNGWGCSHGDTGNLRKFGIRYKHSIR